jgi:hypothetical protein
VKRFRVADLPLDRVLVMAQVEGVEQAERAIADGADLIEFDGVLDLPEDASASHVVTVPAGDPDEMLAFATLAAWDGARVLRTPDVRLTRKVVEMVASIAGTRPPARAVRALA